MSWICACELGSAVTVGNVKPDLETFGVLLFGRVMLAGRVGVKKEPSVPRSRLTYIHLVTSMMCVRTALCIGDEWPE